MVRALERDLYAYGHLEMAWYLYQWGDGVEVLAPYSLRVLIGKHQRGDFARCHSLRVRSGSRKLTSSSSVGRSLTETSSGSEEV